MANIVNVHASYRMTFTTGAVTVIEAATATLGHLLAMRTDSSPFSVRVRTFEPEFILTTAFTAAQEVGFDLVLARPFTVLHTGGGATTMTGGKSLGSQDATTMVGRLATTAGLTAGTHTLEANPIAKGSQWCSAIGTSLAPRLYDFTSQPLGGLILAADEGLVVRNTILMGAAGVGKWHFTIEFDDVIVT